MPVLEQAACSQDSITTSPVIYFPHEYWWWTLDSRRRWSLTLRSCSSQGRTRFVGSTKCFPDPTTDSQGNRSYTLYNASLGQLVKWQQNNKNTASLTTLTKFSPLFVRWDRLETFSTRDVVSSLRPSAQSSLAPAAGAALTTATQPYKLNNVLFTVSPSRHCTNKAPCRLTTSMCAMSSETVNQKRKEIRTNTWSISSMVSACFCRRVSTSLPRRCSSAIIFSFIFCFSASSNYDAQRSAIFHCANLKLPSHTHSITKNSN